MMLDNCQFHAYVLIGQNNRNNNRKKLKAENQI